jgi:ketosteroid isomerase-like protein
LSEAGDNAAIVRAAMEAWNERDVRAVERYVHPDFEWIEVEGSVDMSDRRGRGAVAEVTRDLEAAFEGYRLDPESIEEVDDRRLLAVVRESARGRESGAPVSTTYGYVLTLRDGRIARIEAYRNPASAARAAGLATPPR